MAGEMPKKSPAFLCYAKDLLVSTGEMSNAEFGAYWRNLCSQWVNGSIDSDPNRHPIKYLDGEWEAIKSKFTLCDDGRLRNNRLEVIRLARENYLQKQSAAGKKGAGIRWGKDGNPNSDPIGNPNSKDDGFPIAFPIPSESSDAVSKGIKKKKRREYPAMFEQLWKIHPIGGKDAAYKAMQKLSPDQAEVDRWLAKLAAFKKTQQWIEGISPNMSTWINQGYFDGAVAKPRESILYVED